MSLYCCWHGGDTGAGPAGIGGCLAPAWYGLGFSRERSGWWPDKGRGHETGLGGGGGASRAALRWQRPVQLDPAQRARGAAGPAACATHATQVPAPRASTALPSGPAVTRRPRKSLEPPARESCAGPGLHLAALVAPCPCLGADPAGGCRPGVCGGVVCAPLGRARLRGPGSVWVPGCRVQGRFEWQAAGCRLVLGARLQGARLQGVGWVWVPGCRLVSGTRLQGVGWLGVPGCRVRAWPGSHRRHGAAAGPGRCGAGRRPGGPRRREVPGARPRSPPLRPGAGGARRPHPRPRPRPRPRPGPSPPPGRAASRPLRH